MTVYIRKVKFPTEAAINKYVAKVGFLLRGEKITEFVNLTEILPLNEDDIVVDYIGGMYELFDLMDISHPEYDYPKELSEYYGRKIVPGVVGDLLNKGEVSKEAFIKPRLETKIFTGKVIKDYKDILMLNVGLDYPVWISESVKFLAEWRVFVLNHEIIGIQKYKGAYGIIYNYDVVKNAVKAWQNSPSAYVLDVGLTDTGETLVVEVNDGFSVGFYGLEPCKAAMFLEARWKELTAGYFNKTEANESSAF